MSSQTTFKDINIESYSDYSIVVRGETRKYKEDLKKLGGTYNGRLKGGPGWIFRKTSLKNVNAFVKGGRRLVSDEEIKAGEERTQKYESEREYGGRSDAQSPRPSKFPPVQLSDTRILQEMMKKLDNLTKMVLTLQEKLDCKEEDIEIIIDSDSDMEEEEEKPKRLLR